MLDLIMMESLRQSSVPSATIILFFRALSARTSRIIVMYQAYYVTYCLKNFLQKFGARKSITEPFAFIRQPAANSWRKF